MDAPRKPVGSFILQDRDMALLRDLFESRIMTAAHVAALHFDGRREAAKKRLQKLKAARLIEERSRRANEPAVLFLAKAGFALLREHGVLAEYPAFSQAALEKRARVSDLTIRHELEVMDVKAAFHSAIRKTPTLSIAEFGTWPRMYEFLATEPGGTEVLVRPDGFIRIHEKEADGGVSEHVFFLEVDRSTETQETLVARAVCYLDYYKSGGFAEKNGAPRSAFREYPFRVLMVFKTAERRNNMAERLLANMPPILTQVYLSTIEEAEADPFGIVWMRPADYREIEKGPINPANSAQGPGAYRRQIAREILVEAKVAKVPLVVN